MSDTNPISGQPLPEPPIQRTDSSSQPPPIQPSRKVDTSEGESAYTGDSISTGSSTVSQVLPIKNVTNVFEVFPDIPSLIAPMVEEIGPTPYGSLEKKMIQKNFSEKIKRIAKENNLSDADIVAVQDHLINNKPLVNSSLSQLAKKIGKQAEDETRSEGSLPKEWTIYSSNPKEWIPLPKQPYSNEKRIEINASYDQNLQKILNLYVQQSDPALGEVEVALLQKAVKTGQVDSRVADDFVLISKEATQQTQQNYGLSPSWFKGTSKLEDWVPINTGIVNPISLNKAQGEMLSNNLISLLEDYKKYGVKVREGIASTAQNNQPDDQMSTANFLEAISSAILYTQQALAYTSIVEADINFKLSVIKAKQLEEQKVLAEEQLEQTRKMSRLSDALGIIGDIMKYVGPALATLAVVAACFGPAGWLAAVPLALAAGIMMTYSALDQAFGITQKAVEGVNSVIEKIFPESELMQSLAKLTLVIVALVVAITMIATGTGAAGATRITKLISKEVLQVMLRPLGMQALVITVMNSIPVLPELTKALAETLGLDKTQSELLSKVVLAIEVMMIVIIATAAVYSVAKGIKVSSAATAIKESAQSAANSLKQAIKTFDQTILSALNKIKNAPKNFPKSFHDFIKSLSEVPAALKTMEINKRLLAVTQIAPVTAQFFSSSITSVITFETARVNDELGEIAYRDEQLKQMTRSIEMMMESFYKSIEEHGQASETLGNLYTNIITSYGRSMQTLSQPA